MLIGLGVTMLLQRWAPSQRRPPRVLRRRQPAKQAPARRAGLRSPEGQLPAGRPQFPAFPAASAEGRSGAGRCAAAVAAAGARAAAGYRAGPGFQVHPFQGRSIGGAAREANPCVGLLGCCIGLQRRRLRHPGCGQLRCWTEQGLVLFDGDAAGRRSDRPAVAIGRGTQLPQGSARGPGWRQLHGWAARPHIWQLHGKPTGR
mmetsp:Transcript_18552/g.56002  ORF Transcript_18552/g.56002 Transcript_18552/m.56002 type:complete len:202 (+) Transcript_18552:926-1531(+)